MDEDLALFNEDALDQLSHMEQALLDANDVGVDDENLGALFRAMHTIKGTAGMFGFDEIVSFTHVAENLLDLMRQGKIEPKPQMLDLFLECKDQTSLLVEYAVNQVETDIEIQNHSKSLMQALNVFIDDKDSSETIETLTDEAQLDFSTLNQHESCDIWHISLRFSEDFFTSGMDILSIFNFFNKMGEMVMLTPITNTIKTLDAYEPLVTTIGFEIDFQSDASKAEIEEIFEFVEDDVTLSIFKASDSLGWNTLFQTQEDSQLKALLSDIGVYDEVALFQEVQEAPQISREEAINKVKIEPIPHLQSTKSTLPKRLNNTKKATTTLRVDSLKVDKLINQIGEMVIANAKLNTLAESIDNTELSETMENFKVLLEDVRDGIMGIRMVQVQDSFNKLRRIVSDTAKKLDKEIEFIISGGDTELDKSVVEKISDPLVHMIRNSVDHGIESKEKRLASAKSIKGTIELRAFTDSSSIVIEIEDDGGGINKEVVLQKAKESGIVGENDVLSDKEIFKLIFAAGFSTADEVSDISGRGVGMDVVKRNIESLRGTLDIDSTTGKGSKFTIRLPLTLAVIDGFLIDIGSTKYILPLELISECIEYSQEHISEHKEHGFITIRDEVIPMLNLKTYFQEAELQLPRENIIIAKYANRSVGLIVDELYGEQQIVIKPLGVLFDKTPGISGGTILGSGEVAMIIDIPKLIEFQINSSHKGS